MNPLGVLTARDVMIEGTAAGPTIDIEKPVQDIIQQIEKTALQVTENGVPVGQITQTSLLARLAQKAG